MAKGLDFIKSVVGVGLGLTLGVLAGVVAGFIVGVGIAKAFGVL